MIISNSTPLIYLAKVGRLDLLKKIFGEVLITPEVKQEVVDQGKKQQKPDAFIIEREINAGWIKIQEQKNRIILPFDLDPGEISVLSLALNLKEKEILLDERSARKAAQIYGLAPRGTVYVLLKAVKKRILSFDQFLGILDRLTKEGFRLDERVYMDAIETARNIEKMRRFKV